MLFVELRFFCDYKSTNESLYIHTELLTVKQTFYLVC